MTPLLLHRLRLQRQRALVSPRVTMPVVALVSVLLLVAFLALLLRHPDGVTLLGAAAAATGEVR